MTPDVQPRQPAFRDRVAHRLANAALRIATPWYRNMIRGAISYGMNSAARDAGEGRPAPPPWFLVDGKAMYDRAKERF